MNVTVSWLLEFGLCVIEFYIFYILAGVFFGTKLKKITQPLLVCAFVFLQYWIFQVYANVIVRQGVMVLLFAGLTALIYRPKLIQCVFIAVMFLAITNLSDNIILYGFNVFAEVDLNVFSAHLYDHFIVSYSAKFFEIFIVSMIRAWSEKRALTQLQSTLNYLRFGVFPFVSLISAQLMYIAAVKSPAIAPLLLFCVVLLLAMDIASIVQLNVFEQQQQKLTDSNILLLQMDAAMNNIAVAEDAYKNERKLTHDFQNQIIVIRGMVERDAPKEEMIQYLNGISSYTTSETLSITTHRTAVDVLLNQKYLIAKQKDILFQARLDDLSAFPLPDNALVILLSNLLDNAIEACQKIPDQTQRRILVKMDVKEENCLVSVENSVAELVEIKDNGILSTKGNPERHGYGLRNVATIVDTYDGFYTLRCQDNVFQFVALFHNCQRT